MNKDIFSLVWNFRLAYEEYWPTPNVEDSIRFAFTEIGEVVDAELRGDITYRRNNARDPNIDYELADVAIMLITAMPDESSISDLIKPSTETDFIAWQISTAMIQRRTIGHETAKVHLRLALAAIISRLGYDELFDLIVVRLRRIFTKHIEIHL